MERNRRFVKLDKLLRQSYLSTSDGPSRLENLELAGVPAESAVRLSEAMRELREAIKSADHQNLATPSLSSMQCPRVFVAADGSNKDIAFLDQIERSFGLLLERVRAAYEATAKSAFSTERQVIISKIQDQVQGEACVSDTGSGPRVSLPDIGLAVRSQVFTPDTSSDSDSKRRRVRRRRADQDVPATRQRRIELPTKAELMARCKRVSREADMQVWEQLLLWFERQVVAFCVDDERDFEGTLEPSSMGTDDGMSELGMGSK